MPSTLRERAALAGLAPRRATRLDAEHSLDELAGLAEAAGATVVLRMLQERASPDPATFLGRGKIDALAEACERARVDVVIFDNELSPAQLPQIEARLDRKVIDRTQLILDIFARRARTREGKWQVELAQLKYLLPRLAGSSTALSRLGGGIGTRGPGETKLETDRRRLRQRIHAISGEIDQIRQQRRHLRGRRRKGSVPLVALVGYTNAGKTTLFNLLTKEKALVSDALFVTLDPLVRQVRLPDGRKLLLSDTVGFIDRLPHTLVAAFRATLEQVAQADLVLHVIDAATPDRGRHIGAVERVLEEVGASTVPRLDVFNKCDLVPAVELARLRLANQEAVFISALNGDGRGLLIDNMTERLELDTRRVHLEFDSDSEADRKRIAGVYRDGRVLSHVAQDGRVAIEADLSRRALERLLGPASKPAVRRTAARYALLVLLAVLASACARPVPPPTITAPRYVEFIYPEVPAELKLTDLARRQEAGWAWLQSGDLARAEREFLAALTQSAAFFPAEAALGYLHTARKDYKQAVTRFDRALTTRDTYVPALVGRGEALLALGRDSEALQNFEQALRFDSTLVDVGRRVEVLRFRAAEDNVGAARRAADAGQLDAAAEAYQRAIAASPESAFLYHDLADIEVRRGQNDSALEHYRKAAQLDAGDADARVRLGQLLEARGDLEGAIAIYSEALGIDPRADVRAKIEGLRASMALARLPAQYRAIPEAGTVTRGDLAALIGVRLEPLVRSVPRRPSVITDGRNHWAAAWIMEIAGAGIMDPFANHTFQPGSAVRRTELALAVSRLLQFIGARRPDLRRQWQGQQQTFADLSPANLNYPAASLAVAADVLPLLEGGTFQLSRPVSGKEAIDAVGRLERLFNNGR